MFAGLEKEVNAAFWPTEMVGITKRLKAIRIRCQSGKDLVEVLQISAYSAKVGCGVEPTHAHFSRHSLKGLRNSVPCVD
jgi:hypothetical protein